jgi:hypothetical protein
LATNGELRAGNTAGRSRTGVGFLVCGLLVAGSPQVSRADGGTVRASVSHGGLRVTVFTAPTPPRAGPVDVSVLVQDAATNAPVPAARVRVRAASREHPDRVIERTATKEAATNKLLDAAGLELPEAGWWEFRVRVEAAESRAEAAFDLEVAGPPPGWVAWVGWVAWPAGAVLLFAAHRFLVRRKHARGGRYGFPGG